MGNKSLKPQPTAVKAERVFLFMERMSKSASRAKFLVALRKLDEDMPVPANVMAVAEKHYLIEKKSGPEIKTLSKTAAKAKKDDCPDSCF